MNKLPKDVELTLTHHGGTEESVMGKCPRCKTKIRLVKAREPYHDDYLICPKCDSTYNPDEIGKCSCGFLPSGGMEYNPKCPIHGNKKYAN